ncbi:sugar ABC transporter substrate-binding protein [Herbivorax sp. ANBcel31]|uniref:sugar ABC transporter substrate-binding protein n=1 Tax=Herbivorax sp. ANBcel31 TaxID=3069754 RepID=UPI0027B7FE6D|nr:sugar ABC transporter substrate-binding protein [Herbivorax sp. ANBcel31]MDQ2084869.1 sugar ABC transporter substrate-binding protein [Herbivorax sp. ANBcel31]
MKNSKRLLVICLSVVLVLTFALAGCGDNGDTTDRGDGVDDVDGGDGGSDDIMTLSTFISRAGSNPTSDNRIYNKIRDEFGVEFEFEFVVGEISERVGTMTAGGEYPDLLGVQSNEANQFIDAGAFIPLQDYINDAENYPNLNEHYGELINRISHDDDNVYIMPNYGVHYGTVHQNENWGPSFWIQNEVLREFDYPELTTLDDYFDIIQEYMELYPEIDGQKTEGFVVLTDRGMDWTLRNAPAHLAGAPNDGIVIVDQDDYTAEIFQDKETSRKYYKKLNEMYNAGVVDGESFVMNYDQYRGKLASGAVLGLFDQRWNFNEANVSLREQGKEERIFAPAPIVHDESITDWYLTRPELNVNSGFAISTNAEDPDRIMQFFEAMLDEDWQITLQWGEEGVDYLVDDDGIFYREPEMRNNQEDNQWRLANQARDLLEFMPKMEGTLSCGNATSAGQQPEEYFAGLTESEQELYEAYGVQTQGQMYSDPPENPMYFPAWNINVPNNSPPDMAAQALQDIAFEYLPSIITANPGEFDQKWEEFLEAHENIDVDAFEEHITEGVQRRMEEWTK